jgi:hypothetical protein
VKTHIVASLIAAGMELDGLGVGSAHTVDFTLHAEALALKVGPDAESQSFNFLFAVADGKNEIVESEKRNNVVTLKRDEVRPIEAR